MESMAPTDETLASIMLGAGMHPSFVYAFLKTGLLVGEDSPHTDEEREEFIEAVEDWYIHKEGGYENVPGSDDA